MRPLCRMTLFRLRRGEVYGMMDKNMAGIPGRMAEAVLEQAGRPTGEADLREA